MSNIRGFRVDFEEKRNEHVENWMYQLFKIKIYFKNHYSY